MQLDNDDVTVEYFPNKSRVKNGSPGLAVKLPLGYHIHTGKRSCMLDQNFQPIEVHGSDFAEVSKCSLNALKRIISTQSGNRGEKNEESRQVDTCLDEFGNLSESVKVVLERCNLMRYLCQKARTTGYLSGRRRKGFCTYGYGIHFELSVSCDRTIYPKTSSKAGQLFEIT